jgi:hypothetical protein
MGCALFIFFGIVSAAHVESRAVRLTRYPRAWLVWMQICDTREYGIDDSPRSFHSVFANEQHAISMHSISQETLIGINLVRGGLLDYRKMRGLGDKFFAGSLHSGTEAKRNFSWTEAKAEMIARFVPQDVERRLSELLRVHTFVIRPRSLIVLLQRR